ncbi:hypothetical protein AGLY_016318 [Aphis glycines]|uniref:Uncharacterized protein n=1 Tax=Aphis glycines TaxID=307491 RepID=A0A6G0SY90_APHGL|nr:hypothetical protein AGLY_016318 [Aphis glycines]
MSDFEDLHSSLLPNTFHVQFKTINFKLMGSAGDNLNKLSSIVGNSAQASFEEGYRIYSTIEHYHANVLCRAEPCHGGSRGHVSPFKLLKGSANNFFSNIRGLIFLIFKGRKPNLGNPESGFKNVYFSNNMSSFLIFMSCNKLNDRKVKTEYRRITLKINSNMIDFEIVCNRSVDRDRLFGRPCYTFRLRIIKIIIN